MILVESPLLHDPTQIEISVNLKFKICETLTNIRNIVFSVHIIYIGGS